MKNTGRYLLLLGGLIAAVAMYATVVSSLPLEEEIQRGLPVQYDKNLSKEEAGQKSIARELASVLRHYENIENVSITIDAKSIQIEILVSYGKSLSPEVVQHIEKTVSDVFPEASIEYSYCDSTNVDPNFDARVALGEDVLQKIEDAGAWSVVTFDLISGDIDVRAR